MIDIEALKNYAYDTIGAIHEVHKELGPGLNEKIYQEGLQLELSERNIPYKKELTFHPTYHGKEMEATYRLDFLVNDDIIVELKSVESLTNEHKAQLFNYTPESSMLSLTSVFQIPLIMVNASFM